MRIFVGKGDRFAINKQYLRAGPLGTSVRYSEPNLKPFFSKYGFCIPLDAEGTPIEYILDSELDLPSTAFEKLPIAYRFLRITPEGRIFRVLLQYVEKEDFYHQRPVITDCGWWMIWGTDLKDKFQDILSGFLFTDPTEDQISEFYYKYNLGEELEWFNVSDIVKMFQKDE